MSLLPLPTGSAAATIASSAHTDPRPRPAMDVVFIEGFTGQTVIGIHGGEDRPQPLEIDVHAGVPRARACDTDQIADTIDYSVVRTRLQQLMAGHGFKLLEAFAEAIADMLIHDFGAYWVRVKVVKPRKFDDVRAMGVVIERERGVEPARAGAAGAQVLQLIGAGMVPGR
jgi:dihydroneopterin aldolase